MSLGLAVLLTFLKDEIESNAVITPIVEYLQLAGWIVGGINVVIAGLTEYFKEHSAHRILWRVAWILSAIALLLVVAIQVTVDNPDLAPGRSVSGPIEGGESKSHIFETQAGDEITLIFTELDGLDAEVWVTHRIGDQELSFTPPEARTSPTAKVSRVVTAGTWEITITARDETSGRYRLQYHVERGPVGIDEEHPTRRDRVTAGSENGYVVTGPAGRDVTIQVEPLNEDLQLRVEIYETFKRYATLSKNTSGLYEITLTLREGLTYVLIVGGLESPVGYTLAASSTGPNVTQTTSRPVDPDTEVEIPELYGLLESEAHEVLSEASLAGNTVRVCSSSVDEDRVRQAYLITSEDRELVVVDEPGVGVDATKVSAGSTIHLKISTGEPCT